MAALALEATHGTPAEAWRLKGIHRALVAANQSGSPLDRAANLREAARLNNCVLQLPLDSFELTDEDVDALRLYGLQFLRDEHLVLILTNADKVPAPFADDLARALMLDPEPRRPRQYETPDGALLRLSPHGHYQTPTQKAAARALLTMPDGATLLVSMATGSGKSLLFQLAVLWWRETAVHEKPCAIVVVPTVALALDHEESLKALGQHPGCEALQRCVALTGDMSRAERQAVLDEFERGDIPLLLMAPEMMFGGARERLEKMATPLSSRQTIVSKGRLMGVFIDEAHIVESWGRSFRPDFQRLGGFVRRLRTHHRALRVVLLSATLDRQAADRLKGEFTGAGPYLEIMAGVPRTEFDLVLQKTTNDREREQAVLDVLEVLPRPAMIYTNTREDAKRLYNRLCEAGYRRLALFTGDTGPEQRRRIIEDWRHDHLDLVIATSAFGMGVDKANVRAVVHACLPEDAQRYYQEVGRGGRDGHQALALCVWNEGDRHTALDLVVGQTLTVETAAERWEALYQNRVDLGMGELDGFSGLRLRLNLNDGPARLGQYRGSYNRRWNRSLLVLLQRAGALVVSEVPETETDLPADTWTVILSSTFIGAQAEGLLKEVLKHRDQEEARLRHQTNDYLTMLTQPADDCLWARLFESIEAGRPASAACGRCSICHRHHVRAPMTLDYHGLSVTWPPAEGRSDIEVVFPDTEVAAGWKSFLAAMASFGLVQAVVPEQWAEEAARSVAHLVGCPGLVLSASRLRADADWTLAPVPTVMVAEPGHRASYKFSMAVHRTLNQAGNTPGMPLVVYADPGWVVDDRPFASIATAQPPVLESDFMAQRKGAQR